jgi:excisionase family DNA binding protein
VSTASLSEYGRRLAQQARRIGKSPATLYRMIHQHGLPAMLVGGTWFIKDEDADIFF